MRATSVLHVCRLALAVSALVAATAAAEPSEADRTSALALVREGNALLDKGQAVQALERFRAAQRLVGGDKIRFNLGQALAKLPGHEAEAYRELDLFLERVPNAAPALVRSATKERDRLRGQVGLLRIDTKPAETEIRIDGQPAGTTPLARSVALPPGTHRLEVSAPGFASYQGSVTLAAGQDLAQAVVLAAAPVAASGAGAATAARAAEPVALPAPRPPPPETRAAVTVTATAGSPTSAEAAPVYKRWWFWTALGVLAGAAVVSTVALSRGDEVSHVCPSEAVSCNPLP